MVACCADHVVASPFAFLGSIGVVGTFACLALYAIWCEASTLPQWMPLSHRSTIRRPSRPPHAAPVAGMPNFHRLMDKHELDYLLMTAGKYKRTVHPLTKITDEGECWLFLHTVSLQDAFCQLAGCIDL